MFKFMMTESQKKIHEETVDFVKWVPTELLKAMDREEIEFPYEFDKEMTRRNLVGMRFPEQWGGRGLGWAEEVVALEEVGLLGPALGCQFSLPSIVGEGINLFGNDAQKEKYLKPTLKGDLICAEALTEPRGGSDFFGATTRAEKRDGKWILNGQKRFIVGAKGADFFLVYARTDQAAKDPREALGCFLVERDMGVEVKAVYGLMGTRGGGTGRIFFEDVEVPEANLLGAANQGGEIFNSMMVPERLTSAAGSLGSARGAVEVAARYSDKRKAFGQKIRRFEAVSFMIADAITILDAARSLVWVTAAKADSGEDPRRMVSEAKKFATEAAWEAINKAMQVLGGIGYTNVFPVERMLRDARLPMIWTGTNQIMSLLIQHEYYKELLRGDIITRDVEFDAMGDDVEEEKVYE